MIICSQCSCKFMWNYRKLFDWHFIKFERWKQLKKLSTRKMWKIIGGKLFNKVNILKKSLVKFWLHEFKIDCKNRLFGVVSIYAGLSKSRARFFQFFPALSSVNLQRILQNTLCKFQKLNRFKVWRNNPTSKITDNCWQKQKLPWREKGV